MNMQTVMVPGPMHPDMFDGESPMLVPVEVPEDLRLFRVERHATAWVPETIKETYWVLGTDDDAGYEGTHDRFDKACTDRETDLGCAEVELDDNLDTTVEIPFEELGKHFSDAAQFLQQVVDSHGECELDEDHLPWTPGMAA